MACPTCNATVVFGGTKVGSQRYCNAICAEEGHTDRIAANLPEEQVNEAALALREGPCPCCGRETGLEMFKSYFVYSIILYTRFSERSQLSCRSCARKRQTKDLFGSALAGWWGFPFGLVATPIYMIANLFAMIRNPLKRGPSKALKEQARLRIADRMIEDHAQAA